MRFVVSSGIALSPEVSAVRLNEIRRNSPAMNITPVNAEPSLRHAQEHIFERVSVAREHELLTEALRHGRGRIRVEDLKGRMVTHESSGQLLRYGDELATAQSLQRERHMIEAVNRGQGDFDPLGGVEVFVAADTLGPEQKKAVEFVLGSRDRAVAISGAAGTGKTATLKELRRGLCEVGRDVIAVAPTMSAVNELKSVGFDGGDFRGNAYFRIRGSTQGSRISPSS